VKVKVPVIGTVNRVITVEADAPSRAEVDASIRAAVAALASSAPETANRTAYPTLWRLIREIPPNIQGLAALTDTGHIVRTGPGTFAGRSIAVADTSRLTVTNGSGVAGDPTLDMADISAVSVWGRAANTVGKPAPIAAAANDTILRRTADQVTFGQLTVGMAPNDLWTYAKLQDVSATNRVLGRISSGAGDIEELTAADVGTLIAGITQTWTGAHEFRGAPVRGGTTALVSGGVVSGVPLLALINSGGGTNKKQLELVGQGTGAVLHFVDEAVSEGRAILSATYGTTGPSVGVITFGNTTDNPAFNFVGSGVVTASGVMRAGDGSSSSAGFGFTNAANTGIYLTSGLLAFTVAGTQVMAMASSAGVFRVSWSIADGNVGLPGLNFDNDSNTGMYRNSSDAIGFATGGTSKMVIGTTLVQTLLPLRIEAAAANGAGGTLVIGNGSSSSATAGAQTLPSNPAGFLNFILNNVAIRVPYYAA
jgi:hypothetical protein